MNSELIKHGFIKAGRCQLNGRRYVSGVETILSRFKDERVIYCFVVDDIIEYIGICDSQNRTLDKRMKKYTSRASHQKNNTGTSLEIIKKIKKCLEQGKIVEIYALKPPNNYNYENLKIDLVRGLEYTLIEKFSPSWNKRGTIAIPKTTGI
jgi:uncharacterized protein YerC